MNVYDRKIAAKHLWLIWAIALVLRIVYLILSVSHLGPERMAHYPFDTEVYLAAARHIFGYDPMGDYAILRYGPGFGATIAVIQAIFGDNLLWSIYFIVLMGSLGPVFIYLLAFYLIRIRTVALLAGLISAISMTSIALSCNLLSDQPFFTLQAAAMVCFARGFMDGKFRWFIASGLLASIAVLIRSTAQFWPLFLMIIPLIIPVLGIFVSRLSMIGRVSVTAGIILLTIIGWSYRNDVKHGIFTFGTNGAVTIRSCLGATAIVENTEENDIIDLRIRWEAEDGDRSDEYVESYGRAWNRFLKIFSDHPVWVIRAYLKTVWSNIRTGNYLPIEQIPAMEAFWRWLIKIHEKWLGILIFFASLAGIVYLFIDNKTFSAVLLGLTFSYFTLLSGLSYWQGSRIYFPTEMAWSILVVYTGYRLWPRLRNLKNRLLHR